MSRNPSATVRIKAARKASRGNDFRAQIEAIDQRLALGTLARRRDERTRFVVMLLALATFTVCAVSALRGCL